MLGGMVWNFDFDYSAILFVGLLILYTVRRRDLPLLRNAFFLVLMLVTMAVAVFDVIASIFSSLSGPIPYWFLYLINILYYLALALSPLVFLLYCFSLTRMFRNRINGRLILSCLPFVITSLVTVTTSKHHLIFFFDEHKTFFYGPSRPLFYVETILYLAWAMIHVTTRRGMMRKSFRLAVYLYSVTTMIGHTMQVFINPYTQTVSISVALGILIIYLTYQNPDYYRDKGSTLFSPEGFEELKVSENSFGLHRSIAMMYLVNYQELQAIYGTNCMLEVVEKVSVFMRVTFPKEVFFYLHRGIFAVIREKNTDLDRIREVCSAYLQKPVLTSKGDVMVHPTFGLIPAAVDPMHPRELMMLINILRSETLKPGSGVYACASEEMVRGANRERKVEAALSRACSGEGLEVFYQPIYSVAERKITCAEALVRIRDPKLGLLFPDEFIHKAEANGSIITLGRKIFEEVCIFIRDHDMEALGLDYIEVNLSPIQCVQTELANSFLSVMQRSGVYPEQINLEVTESTTVDARLISDNMNTLATIGVTFALDDYGTGFSNLVSVLSLPLRLIKIDKSIVWAYFREGNDLLLDVIRTFHNKKMQIVCEGVEEEEMANALMEMGCDYLQGYYYSKPIPEGDFIRYLQEGR